jgi:hypothetical protein
MPWYDDYYRGSSDYPAAGLDRYFDPWEEEELDRLTEDDESSAVLWDLGALDESHPFAA